MRRFACEARTLLPWLLLGLGIGATIDLCIRWWLP